MLTGVGVEEAKIFAKNLMLQWRRDGWLVDQSFPFEWQGVQG
jgi:hypothetical protein